MGLFFCKYETTIYGKIHNFVLRFLMANRDRTRKHVKKGIDLSLNNCLILYSSFSTFILTLHYRKFNS